ncbi:MAG: hypothetical protein EZS28_014928 [Streblomastix strix]|uniref:Tail fiber protein n=1 Tax=Streblomastix strix TaxID=222440 RepID=A0A5J4W483_9EUKA|nr:MAG: hypothetical protein EZS28_014928 [Streblomastix strix]
MGFFSNIANFGSKILGGVKHVAQWIAPTLHKVLSTVAGPVGMIHPGIGGALGAAYYFQYSKRGGNSAGGMLQNEDYQLFIDNDNALVYAANNQIIDGQASDFALKIAPDVNQLQSTVGSIDADIVGVKNDIDIVKQELARQQHFRGYYLLNTDITSLPESADGDFAFSTESGTVWMYSDEPQAESSTWYNSGQVVPDQVSPASDAVPLVDNATGVAGISTEYSRGDHQHPLQISSVLPSADTATGEAGTANTYARFDHTHHVNLSNGVPLKDSGTGTAGASNIYASATHQHPLNIDPTVANVPMVNATAAANGTSDFYSRNNHVHPQQLTYDGNITATKFIKTGGLPTEILCANGDTTAIDAKLSRTYTDSEWIRLCVFPAGNSPKYTENGITNVYGIFTAPTYMVQNYVLNAGTPSSFAGVSCGAVQINPNGNNFYEGIRISRSAVSNYSGIYLGCNPSLTSGSLTDQWSIVNTPTGELRIGVGEQLLNDNQGLQISADGNTLSFNGSVIAGVGATNGASGGTVNYSAGNPILWGVNSVDTNGEFYSNGPKVYWRARPITMGSVPP